MIRNWSAISSSLFEPPRTRKPQVNRYLTGASKTSQRLWGMTRSARGTRDEPGRNVGAKAGLNRVILNTGWSAMEQMLSCKAVELVRVPAAFTSQTCSACGVIDADSRCSQESFKCVACGQAQNADLNAARNILASATGASARRGAFTSVTQRIREMDTGYTTVWSSIQVTKRSTREPSRRVRARTGAKATDRGTAARGKHHRFTARVSVNAVHWLHVLSKGPFQKT